MNNHIGEVYKNRLGLTGEIVEKTKAKSLKGSAFLYNILIKETGNIITVSYSSIIRGVFKDWTYPAVLGIGISFEGATKHKLYSLWYGMLHRCYNTEDSHYKNYGGIGVKVSNEWLSFKNFIHDFNKIEGYNNWIANTVDTKLDKDVKGNGLLYSLENCKLISNEENCQYTKRVKRIICIDMDGIEEKYSSINRCAKKLNLDASTICKVLKGKQKLHKGYYFKYESEVIL